MFSPYATYNTQSPFTNTYIPSSYDVYDARRTLFEQRQLALQQQERRELEARALHQRQVELEAARRLRLQELYYHQQKEREEEEYRAHLELQEQKRAAYIQAAREQELLRRRQAQAQAQAQAEQEELYRRRLAARKAHHQQQQRQHQQVVDPFNLFFQQLLNGQAVDEAKSDHEEEVEEEVEEEEQVTQPTATTTATPVVTVTSPSPVATPSPAPAPTEPSSPVDDEAATTLQRHYRAHLARRAALKTLATLSSSLDSHKSSYAEVAPSALVFQPSPPSSTVSAESQQQQPAFLPKLAFASSNAPFLAYEDFLVGLLTQVDQVQSGGDRVVKAARKELVKKIETELSELDRKKDGEFERVSASASPVPEVEVEASAEAEVETQSEEAPTTTEDVTMAEDPTEAEIEPLIMDDTPTPTTLSSKSESEASPEPETTPSVPLTSDALASLPTSQRPARTANSDTDSTESASTLAVDLDEVVGNVLKAAGELGDKVARMELDEQEDGGFVVV